MTHETPFDASMGMAMAVGMRSAYEAGGEAVRKKTSERAVIKNEPSLGDINPLIHTPDLGNRNVIDTLALVAREKISEYRGLIPLQLDVMNVFDPHKDGKDASIPRFVARFETDHLTERQLASLERLVAQTYKKPVRTRTSTEGKEIPTETYPPIFQGQPERSKTGGWYMGPDSSPTSGHHQGLFVFKDLGEVNRRNFLKDTGTKSKYIVEVREADLYQTDLVEFVVQVGLILGRSRLLDHGQLLYDIYYDLIRRSLKKIGSDSAYGLDYAIREIYKGLILPLASPDLSGGITHEPQSVLLVGVPGTGKTLTVEELLQLDTGVFIVPLDALELRKELMKDKDKQQLMQRIAEVSASTGRRVVLHVDDITNMITEDRETQGTILNLIAGVIDNEFYVIASTNEPRKIDRSLIQPQRFGITIFYDLHSEEARRAILNIHVIDKTRRLCRHLFPSEEAREFVIEELAKLTDGYTPRYLAEIANAAKANFELRVKEGTGKAQGLTEEDAEGYYFTIEDWEQAFRSVSDSYNREETIQLNKSLLEFVIHRKGKLGFDLNGHEKRGNIFSSEAHERFDAIRHQSPNGQESS